MSLAFFNGLSIVIHIDLSEPAQRVSPRLENRAAPKHATITDISASIEVFERSSDNEDITLRPITESELQQVVFDTPTIRLQSDCADEVTPIEHKAPNGKSFTVTDLVDAIVATEREHRAQSEWLGGVDVHHVFFEGIHLENGVWHIHWGS